MSYLTNLSLLPQERIEHDLKTQLRSIVSSNILSLKNNRPRIYQDLCAYALDPFYFPGCTKENTLSLNEFSFDPAIYWQQLILQNDIPCSELVIMNWQSVIYVAYLSILPDTFGLFSPLSPKSAMAYVDTLVNETIDKVIGVALVSPCYGLVSDIYNPNLAAIFKCKGFKESLLGSEIIGLPLPARFYLTMDPLP